MSFILTAPVLVAVALAGGVGAVARFAVDELIRSRITSAFPVGTVVINVSGSLLLGFLAGLLLAGAAPAELHTIAGTGFLGGYTTFSTANVETVRLIQSGRTGTAITNALGTMVLAVVSAGIGLSLGALL